MQASETLKGKDAEIRCLGGVLGRRLLTEAAQNRCCAVKNSRLYFAGPSSSRAILAGAGPRSGHCVDAVHLIRIDRPLAIAKAVLFHQRFESCLIMQFMKGRGVSGANWNFEQNSGGIVVSPARACR